MGKINDNIKSVLEVEFKLVPVNQFTPTFNNVIHLDNRYGKIQYLPILITRASWYYTNTNLVDGEWLYHEDSKELYQYYYYNYCDGYNNVKYTRSSLKVVALPDNFSPKELESIVSGKLEQGKYFIEIDNNLQINFETNELDNSKYVILYKSKSEYSYSQVDEYYEYLLNMFPNTQIPTIDQFLNKK